METKVDWVENLPDNGGAWGKGVIETCMALEAEIETLEAKRQEVEASLREFDSQIKVRKKLLRQQGRRAEKEAVMLYGESVVKDASGK